MRNKKENKAKPKTPQESAVEMRELVMPHQANPQNTIFGGVLMSWIDMAAAMVASRHSNQAVVTAHIESIDFKTPVKVGHHVLILACMNFVGKTSMEIGVKVICENPLTGASAVATTAYLTFVALDEFGRPSPVPPLKLVTTDDVRRFENAEKRTRFRKELKNNLK